MKRSTPARIAAERLGRTAEAEAAAYLMSEGWSIVGERRRTPVGEVDLVARRGKVLAFVEVKARASKRAAQQSLDHHRLTRVAAAAEFLLPELQQGSEEVRIDVIYVVPDQPPEHLADVWQG